MRIQSLRLQNFRGFNADPEIIFPKDNNIAVFIGVNGAGKSSILDAIGFFLANFVLYLTGETTRKSERLRRDGFLLTDNDINKKSDHTLILADLLGIDSNAAWYWKMSKERNGYEREKQDIKINAKQCQITLSRNSSMSLPVLAYYQALRLSPYSESKTSSKKKVYRFSQFAAFEDAFERSALGFDAFTNWFRQQEDLENQIIVRENRNYHDPKLEIIRTAIKTFFNSLDPSTLFEDLRVVRASKEDVFTFSPTVESNLEIQKGAKRLHIEQLSDGERSLLLIVADIARRLAIANPSIEDPIQVLNEGNGIVLIDEIDAHLHPQWQRTIIPALNKTFKGCQFIVTTHSPQVLSNVERDSIFILEDGKIVENNPHSYGRDTNSILYEFMGVEERPKWMREKLDHCFHLIDQGELDDAKAAIEDLKQTIGENDTEIVRANTMLAFLYD
jgi:predicted ATP-binding protein involved in virulence